MRVLIVDQEKASQESLVNVIHSLGYETRCVAIGSQAIEVCNEFAPDIVLLDVATNDIALSTLVPELKAQTSSVYLPIILLADVDNTALLDRYLQQGGDDFLTKPFNAIIFQAKIRAHIRTRELSRSVAEQNRSLAWHSEHMQQEHRIVQNIFSNALSRSLQDFANIQTYLRPHTIFNGDLYLLARGPLGNLYLLLGDFTGHGLPAAIGTLPASQTFFAMAELGAPVGQIAEEINRQLYQLLPESMFCCATILELSPSGERISWWSGGMPPALLISPTNEIKEHLQPQHMPLGILSTPEFESGITITRATPKDRLLLYSDGAIEVGAQQGNSFGYENFKTLGKACRWQLDELASEIERRIEQDGSEDDISLALLHCIPTGLSPKEKQQERLKLPFQIVTRLGPEEIRGVDPVSTILSGLSQLEGFKKFKAPLYTVLAEAYNNAVDHGLLRLTSSAKSSLDGFETYYIERSQRLMRLQHGYVEIILQYVPKEGCIYAKISDSGQGFKATGNSNQGDEYTFGRGLMLMKELTQDLVWSDDGRCVEFTFSVR
ncbi:hypothetical protein CWE08_05685 [Aliidiomarina iranensis]|uniref:Response regulatory domain-containing protein n=1 Tax=Aliidiomarina iranensis TaxID=1434071 RepID=A0A432W0W2_9GAMM|nr:SpoIIE family protein phosphatase [Aliidiomarina iranensis]RUO22655.1 hypothetical protein CWE08_05685 [Aliidiomarina iranensis]